MANKSKEVDIDAGQIYKKGTGRFDTGTGGGPEAGE